MTAEPSDVAPTEADQPAAGQPAAGQPAAGQPDTGQPDAGQPDTGQPDTGQPDAGQPDTDAPDDLPEQMRIRRAKYDRLMTDPERAPFPATVARTRSLADIRALYPDLAAGTETGDLVGITGRVIFFRNTGKLCFATRAGGWRRTAGDAFRGPGR